MDAFELQDNMQALQDLTTYDIPNEHDVPAMDARAIAALLEHAVEALADSPDAIADPAVFDAYRSLLKHADALQGTLMTKLLDSVSSAFQAHVDAILRDDAEGPHDAAAHKAPLEMYAFLVHWFVQAAEKVKAAGDEDVPAAPAPKAKRGRGAKAGTSRAAAKKQTEHWTWVDQIPNTLNLIARVLRLKTQRIWVTSIERDTFIGCVSDLFKTPHPSAVCHGAVMRACCAARMGVQTYDRLPCFVPSLASDLLSWAAS